MAKECKICGYEFYMNEYRDSTGAKKYIGWCKECGSMFIRSQNISTRKWIEYWRIPKLADKPKVMAKEDLGDKLCDYCSLEKKGVYSVPGGCVAGCEGSSCDDAYDNYLDERNKIDN